MRRRADRDPRIPDHQLALRAPDAPLPRQSDNKLELREGRRPAGYQIFDTRNNTVRTAEQDLVNRIRERVDAWRAADYPGVTSMTRQLAAYWQSPEANRQHAFYFSQIEATETLIWHVEAPASRGSPSPATA